MLHHYNNRLGRPNKKKILNRVCACHGSTNLAIVMTTLAYRKGASELVYHSVYSHYYREDDMSEDELLEQFNC